MADSVLEEAIRQHLELKRSRGADPDEMARLEHEALGPVKPVVAEPVAEDLRAAAEDRVVTEDPATVGDAEDPALVAQANSEHAAAPASAEGDPAPGETQGFDPLLEDPAGTAAPVPDPEAPAAPAGDRPLDGRGGSDGAPAEVAQPPVQPGQAPPPDDWLVEGEEPAAPAQAPGDPDVLERTPEFLEETPEHDRLWFEQKPPRDFDFDG